MSKKLAIVLSQYFSRGVNTGAMAMSLALVISMENVLPEYIEDEDTLNEIFKRMEDDVREVWGEATAHTTKDEEIATLLIGHAEEIRKKRGLEALE
jgi:hypothetical protein